MCGISGILNLSEPKPIEIEQINSMVSVLNHRGPDEAGAYIDDWIGLGHARLSIIGLDDGVQPIHNENESLWIIFNGEIFNYPELKKDLIKKGHKFYTSTDTEVILHLYEEKGIECLNFLNGQFAFAIWNTNTKELFLARDRVGIRPLHYTFSKDRFIFASEIKSIFTQKNIEKKFSYTGLDQIFTFWSTLPGYTAFQNIMELPPGYYIRISKNNFELKKYWQLPLYSPEEQINDPVEKVRENINEILIDAVKIRLRADVPVGSYLSGGLDSSGITSVISKNFNNNLNTFGIRFEEKKFDEGDFQTLMVDFLQTNHTEILVKNDEINRFFNAALWHIEKPVLRTAPVPLFLLSKEVNKRNYKVVVTGEGADEIFGGYNIFKEAKVRDFWSRQPDSKIRPLLLAKLYPYILNTSKPNFTLQNFFGAGLLEPDNPFFSHIIRWNNTSRIKNFFSDDINNELKSYNALNEFREFLPGNFSCYDYMTKAQFIEITTFLSSYLLSSQGDRVAMANSVEMRLPYLDYRLIDYMAKVPSELKLKMLDEKFILKKVLKNYLPEKVINRPKNPYRAPISESLFKSNISLLEEKLGSRNIREAGIFKEEKVKLLINKFGKLSNPGETDNMALTGILSTQLLFNMFITDSEYSNKPMEFNIIFDRRKVKEKFTSV